MSGIATLTHDWDSRLIGKKKTFGHQKTTPISEFAKNGRFLLAEVPITDTDCMI